MPPVSIVIPVRNESRRIGRCLDALRDQSFPASQYEIIVVDDGSDDDSAAVAAGRGAHVIRQGKKGAAAARNRGIQEAQGDVILFTDADCVADREWVERLSLPLREQAASGAVGRCFSNQKNWVAGLIQLELDERYAN